MTTCCGIEKREGENAPFGAILARRALVPSAQTHDEGVSVVEEKRGAVQKM